MAMNFEPHECVMFVQSTKTGTYENKADHSISIGCKAILAYGIRMSV